jgi:hypothetical protein
MESPEEWIAASVGGKLAGELEEALSKLWQSYQSFGARCSESVLCKKLLCW